MVHVTDLNFTSHTGKTVLPNLWKRNVVAEQFRWWLATDLEIGMQALLLVLIKGFLQPAQLYITSEAWTKG